ncbi:MAG: glycosyltransferase family 4 protein [Actinobacteria bacterium]|nr:glycosyltransferase family 4 protein [Actinomycetota bacterium]
MKVLMLAQTYAPVVGGEERHVEDLSGELARRGHEVVVATLRQPGGEEAPRRPGVRVRRLDSSVHRIPGIETQAAANYAPPLPDPVTTAGLRSLLREERPDVVHAHNWLVNSYLPLARRLGVPLVLSLHDYGLLCPTKRLFLEGAVCAGPAAAKCLRHAVDFYGPAKGALVAGGVAIADPWVRRRVDLFVSVSTAVAELCRVAGLPNQRVIPNFAPPPPPPPADADERLAFLPSGDFALYFGDVSEDKGARVLLEAHAGLPGAPPLVMIGRRSIDGLDRARNVIAPGPLPHPLAIEAVRRSAFTVAPSVWAEPFGIVALEAGAAGKPVLASAVGGLRDVVVDGVTGRLLPGGDVAALRAAMAELFADRELRGRMGAAAATRIPAVFSPAAVVPRFEAVYREVTARRSPASA